MSSRVCFSVEEFIDEPVEDTIEIYIKKKISLLYDFDILHGENDPREKLVKKWLSSYSTFTQIDNALHDVVRGNMPLNTVLRKKSLM